MEKTEQTPLFFSAEGTSRFCAQPNFAYFNNKAHDMRAFRLGYLWEEYRQACEKAGERPYAFSTFCHHFAQWRGEGIRESAPIWFPGEYMQAYWSAVSIRVEGCDEEWLRQAIFVARLVYSDYTFICPSEGRTTEDWMRCCTKAFRFFGGVPHVTECSVLDGRTEIEERHSVYATLHAFASHYKTVLYGVGPKTGKTDVKSQKALAVKRMSPVVVRLREELEGSGAFKLAELETRIAELVQRLNSEKDSGDKSRHQLFEEREKAQLLSLPNEDYDLSKWATRQVGADYHFILDGVKYSVPYPYAFEPIRIHCDDDVLHVYSLGSEIATHEILKEAKGRNIVTNPAHRPPTHRGFAKRMNGRFLAVAKSSGPATELVMKSVLEVCEREGNGFRECKNLLDLRRNPAEMTLEEACSAIVARGGEMTVRTVAALMHGEVAQ